MSKTYVIGISEDALNTIDKVKGKNNDVITILFSDNYSLTNNKNVDINVRYNYSYNDFKGTGYKGIAEDLKDSIKEEVENLKNKLDKNDRIILFNDFIRTGSLEIFYYLCESLGDIVDNCYVIFNEGYRFQGIKRREYNKEIADKIYKLNYRIYEIDGNEVAKIRESKNITSEVEATYNEFYNYIESILKGKLI